MSLLMCCVGDEKEMTNCVNTYRLRQVDVKAEHFERHAQRLEQERDEWEKKFEVRSILILFCCLSILIAYLFI